QPLFYKTATLTYQSELEQPTIQSISADGLTVTLKAPLRFGHFGEHDAHTGVDFLPQVADVTRNIVIRSESSTGTRGYTLFTNRANVDIHYATFGGLGRTEGTVPFDNTIIGSTGVTHLGSNETNRSAINFLNLFGPTTSQANGYQYTFQDNVVMCR